MWGTPVGSSFRDLISLWEEAEVSAEKKNQIKMLVDGQNFILFFEFENDVYGTHEQHRITFSRMKEPDSETDEGWIKDANFMAFNLSSAVSGKPQQRIFYAKELSQIHVISKEEAYDQLVEIAEKNEPKNVSSGAKAILQIMQSQRKSSGQEPSISGEN